MIASSSAGVSQEHRPREYLALDGAIASTSPANIIAARRVAASLTPLLRVCLGNREVQSGIGRMWQAETLRLTDRHVLTIQLVTEHYA